MNPVWSITLAENHPLPSITLHYMAPDEESARAGIQKWYPGRRIISVLPNPNLGDAALSKEPVDPFVRSDEIKQEYLNSACEASDVDVAVLRLMEECGELFEDNEAAWSFLMEETHENKENPNENCLDGFKCPKCGSFGPFRIRATVSGETLVSDDGTEGVEGDVEWADTSSCRCVDCGHAGTVREFQGKPAPEFEAFQQIVANTYDDGEHACHTPDDIDRCGDGLLTFLMHELSSSEDCDSAEEAISRVNVAIRQLEAVRNGLEVATLDRTHLLSNWRVSLYEDKNDRTATILFECQAENGAHAAEQAENAYPNGKVVSIEIIQEASK